MCGKIRYLFRRDCSSRAKDAVANGFISSRGNHATGKGVQAVAEAYGAVLAALGVPLAQFQPTPAQDGVVAEQEAAMRSVSEGTTVTSARLAELQPAPARDDAVGEREPTARSESVGTATSIWGVNRDALCAHTKPTVLDAARTKLKRF